MCFRTVQYLIYVILVLACCMSCSNKESGKAPVSGYNVLMIMVDDQNALLNEMYSSHVKTPNIKRLAKRSLFFKSAYCAAPACGPSRTALMTGIHPSKSGVYYNNQNFRMAEGKLRSVVDLSWHFKNNGYLTTNFGKVFHNSFQEDNLESFTKGYFFPLNTGKDLALVNNAKEVTRLQHPMWYYGPLPNEYDRDDTTKMQQDTRNTNRTIELLQQDHDKPFFCALGIWKPHGPWYVPQRYYDLYPPESIPEPEGFLEGDLKDVPECARWLANHRGIHKGITERGLWKRTLQAYYASITYADEQLGRVLDALEASDYAENTIVLYIGDNGFHNGQKEHWSKFTLWDLATRVPLMISLPNDFSGANKIFNNPVSLLDIYPTLTELCGLPTPETHNLDGISLVPILDDTSNPPKSLVVSTYGKDCHAVIGDDYYYIQYRNKENELYDVRNDIYQLNNLARDPQYQAVIDSMSRLLPDINVDDIVYSGGATRGSHGWDEGIFE